ncbi:MAG: hypothetical protein N0E55_06935 [Candidatus Thiodiazotropha taylori]|nr:hypothetical protein [Candidatus Thiodiazotropha taylori]RLW55412.1 MAG: hypothetical protein B6D76_03685 [gamma proteobacterium symbiont of Stewartia floridana]MCG7868678.1 hypothetical protein [Candidatus Thiodiazotropha taylori]MCG7896225.1 hypothetical protein [Candidatus Thiodiazotropha taylori]MCG7905392.1 hypothetical protein [Candidatus Thiodiazotropha taylori]
MRAEQNFSNCTLCRVMRGLAFGGIGAAVGGYGALFFGVDRNEAVYYALFGAFALTVFILRKRKPD